MQPCRGSSCMPGRRRLPPSLPAASVEKEPLSMLTGLSQLSVNRKNLVNQQWICVITVAMVFSRQETVAALAMPMCSSFMLARCSASETIIRCFGGSSVANTTQLSTEEIFQIKEYKKFTTRMKWMGGCPHNKRCVVLWILSVWIGDLGVLLVLHCTQLVISLVDLLKREAGSKGLMK